MNKNNISVTHWGEDYATVLIAGREFEVSIALAEAIEEAVSNGKRVLHFS